MAGDHDRFDSLALGHVLGGLDDAEAAEFRSHLLSCRECRRRVSELRGIAASLENAEREERAQLQVKTEAPEDGDEPDAQEPAWYLRPRVLLAGAGAIVVLALGLLYVFHLRTTNEALLRTTEVRESVLQELGQGMPLPAELTAGVSGVVSSDGSELAYSLAGIPALDRGDVVVVWRMVDGDERMAATHRASSVRGGLLAGMIDAQQADRVVISVESEPADAPGGDVLVDAPMPVD